MYYGNMHGRRSVDEKEKRAECLYFMDRLLVPLVGCARNVFYIDTWMKAHRSKSLCILLVAIRCTMIFRELCTGGLGMFNGRENCYSMVVKKGGHDTMWVDEDVSRFEPVLVEYDDIFVLSKLDEMLADASLHVSLDEIKVDKTLRFVKEPVEIMDREVKRLKRIKISLVKVCWNSKRGPEFTWERVRNWGLFRFAPLGLSEF
ncbi:hypothetical protein Tco_0505411 [Tanacetum coccineum]